MLSESALTWWIEHTLECMGAGVDPARLSHPNTLAHNVDRDLPPNLTKRRRTGFEPPATNTRARKPRGGAKTGYDHHDVQLPPVDQLAHRKRKTPGEWDESESIYGDESEGDMAAINQPNAVAQTPLPCPTRSEEALKSWSAVLQADQTPTRSTWAPASVS